LSANKENKDEDDNASMFYKLINLRPPTYNRAADTQAFKEWIWDI